MSLHRCYSTAFRSRHYVPKQRQKTDTMRLLEPHTLAARLKHLAEKKQLDLAVAMLKNAPLAAQNTPVWNTLIWECLKARKFKLGYQLFVDMKRRGFSPTTRTFQTMFNGLSRIDEWSEYQQQLQNARSLYTAYQRHVEDLAKRDPKSSELDVDPLPAYATILGKAGKYDEMVALYYVAAQSGPPNKFLFTAIFQAFARDISPEKNARNAADARVIWQEAQKIPGMEIDSFMVTTAVLALSRGQDPEQKLAFQLLRDYFGLALSSDRSGPGKIPLTSPALAAALLLCNNAGKPSEAVTLLHQVRRRPEVSGGADIIDRLHVEEVLRAINSDKSDRQPARTALQILDWVLERGALAARPTHNTFTLLLSTCWNSADWDVATRVFTAMTGYRAHDFMDGAVSKSPRVRHPAATERRNIAPTAETMSALLRTALATQNHANMRQCLRIVAHFNAIGEGLFVQDSEKQTVTTTNKATKKWAFHVVKFADAVVQTVDAVFAATKSKPEHMEIEQWGQLRQAALDILSKGSAPARSPRPTRPRSLASISKPNNRSKPTKRIPARPASNYERSFRP